MVDYSLVIGSKFSPFSYEELLKPALMATQAHQELENQYSELATKANVWEEMANEQTDPYAYQMYKKYSDDLKNQADILASQGLTPASRKALVAMKNRYSSEITPIETAYKKRQSLIDQQREALLKDDTLIFDTDYSTASLDTLIKNPNATFTPLSGEAIAKRTAAMAKEAASAMLNDPEYKTVFNSQYVQQKIMQGYDMSQIIAAAQRDPNAPKALLGIVDTIKGQVGYNKWSYDNKKKIDNYINEGLEAAAGSPKIDIMSNRNYESDIDRERMDLAKEQFEYETKGVKQPDGSYYKPLGGGKVLHTKPDGTHTIIGTTSKEEESAQLEELFKGKDTLGDIKELGFTPVGVVAKTGGSWSYGQKGDDASNVAFGFTRSQVVTDWGNYTYTPDNGEEITYISDVSTIPGFSEEYMKGTGTMPDSNTAFGQIVKAAKNVGITDDEFRTNRVIIAKVKSEGKRSEPYDYVIFRKN